MRKTTVNAEVNINVHSSVFFCFMLSHLLMENRKKISLSSIFEVAKIEYVC